MLAASGDSGAADVKFNEGTYYLHPVTSWPDSDPLVTGIGGTQLRLSAKGAVALRGVERHLQRGHATSTSSAARARTRWPAAAGSR